MVENGPGYWQHETSGVIRPVIEAYLRGEALTPHRVAIMRAYLQQWINVPGFSGSQVEALRQRVRGLDNRDAIQAWLSDAAQAGVDPL